MNHTAHHPHPHLRTATPSPPEGERGSVLVLVLGLVAILLVLVVVVVDVSAVVLAKRAVASAADGAAVSAAQSLDLEAVYAGQLGSQLPLDAQQARARVARYQAEATAGQPGLRLSVVVDGRTVLVLAERSLHLPLRVPGSSGRVLVSARARAQAPTLP